ncbi:hypothetical protein Taro_047224 [Colocasia esculenta]|uniref:Uncharacterized protein n=1 Tax=Colocasia esculenta TaxID=4460 RepID=A0A843X6X9_COLES|nr:hypothetical protein [Colocasia esculenta]
MVVLMGGFARIGDNEITILGNDAEISTDIDLQEAQQTLEKAEANLSKAEDTHEDFYSLKKGNYREGPCCQVSRAIATEKGRKYTKGAHDVTENIHGVLLAEDV